MTIIGEPTIITDELIIKVLKNVWDHLPWNRIADALLTTKEVAQVLEISPARALKRLKKLDGNQVKGRKYPGCWLWRYDAPRP